MARAFQVVAQGFVRAAEGEPIPRDVRRLELRALDALVIDAQLAADRGPVDLGVARVPLRLSAGCATFPTDGDDYQSLLARADHRMYQDKAARRSGRPRHELSSSRGVPVAPGTAAPTSASGISRDVA